MVSGVSERSQFALKPFAVLSSSSRRMYLLGGAKDVLELNGAAHLVGGQGVVRGELLVACCGRILEP